MIKKVDSLEEALECNKLLELLIKDECKYDNNCMEISVSNYFENLYLKDDNIIFIDITDNKIVGYIYVKTNYLNETKEAFIDGLYVLEEYRNNGIATNLIKEAKKWCIDNNLKTITINVLANNTAKELYYKEGFNDFKINLKIDL